VGVQVDEAGRDDQAVGVERALRLGRSDAADLRDATASDADVGAERRIARSVNHRPPANHEIELWHGPAS
jgi:hypothetical protein